MAEAGRGSIITDAQLVEAARSGNADSFGALVDRHWGFVVALASAKTGDHAAAEDIAQESFLKAHAQLYSLRDPTRFPGWLSSIVIQQTINQHRCRSREKLVVMSRVPEAKRVNESAQAGNPGLSPDQCRFVRDAVGKLPPKFQTVIVMRFISGLSAPEIARQLDKRPGTIRIWLHRAYGKLRVSLTPLLEEVKTR